MTRRTAAALAVAAIVGAALVVWLVVRGGGPRDAVAPPPDDTPDLQAPTAAQIELRLAFPDRSGRLRTELRQIDNPGTLEGIVRRALEDLLAGPLESGLLAPLPQGVTLADVFISAEGVAYVDLASEDDASPPPSGSRAEILAVYSLVNSVLLTAPELRGVALLWNGDQRPTFAGHLDTSRPLRLKAELIAGGL